MSFGPVIRTLGDSRVMGKTSQRSFIFASVLLCAAHSVAFAGTTLFVDDDAPVGGDGASWATSFRFLQDALAAAHNATELPVEIRIGGGDYLPDQSAAIPAGTKARNAAFLMRNNVAIRGGYAGMTALATNGDPNFRDIEQFTTRFTGDLDRNDGDNFANSEENAFQVVVALNVDDTAILDGVTISNGRADRDQLGPTPDSHDQGAGINIYHAQPQILNCTLEKNWNLNHGAINDHGSATISGCTFRDNYSDSFGAGLYIHSHSATQVDSCLFVDNVTPNEGGGLYVRSAGDGSANLNPPRITFCFFGGNRATLGGGLYNAPDSAAEIANCFFSVNEAVTLGGGMYCAENSSPIIRFCEFVENIADTGAGFYAKDARPTLDDCLFERNNAEIGEGGGGAWVEDCDAQILNCTFLENSGFNGGGLYNGGAICPTVRNCTFVRNIALNDNGGGISNVTCDPLIVGCTFIENQATTNSGNNFVVGGGMASYLCSPTVIDCLFRGNSAILGAGGMYNEGGTPVIDNCRFEVNRAENGAAIYNLYSAPTIRNSAFWFNTTNNPSGNGLGGAIMNAFDCNLQIEGCTFADNTSDGGGTLATFLSFTTIRDSILWGNTAPEIEDFELSTTVEYSIVAGGWSVGANIFDVDPQFVAPANGDLTLSQTSPAIDAGDPAQTIVEDEVDEAGSPRFANCRIDLGSYEFPASSISVGDVNFDGAVTVADIGSFVDALLGAATPASTCRADVNQDGFTSVADIGAFIAILQQ